MSEERLERIENQLSQVLEALSGVDHRMTGLETRMTGLEDRMTGLEDRMTGLEDRMTGLETRMTGLEDRVTSLETRVTRGTDRVDIMEGTLLTTMRGGFNSLRGLINDIDVDLARNERKTEDNARKVRRLNSRLMHLEGRTAENIDPDE